jgi:hypothetical protein
MTGKTYARTVVCADALTWLPGYSGAIVTSPPDAEEIGATITEWEKWFFAAVTACAKSANGAPCVFYVTDRKHAGQTHSKAGAVLAAMGTPPTWHKIALRRPVGSVDIHRPGFSHLIAFNGRPGRATPDVFERGPCLYRNATGLNAARVACAWVGGQASEVCDPFCGIGTIPAVANALGLDAIGVDIDPAQCRAAELCSISPDRMAA